MKERHGIKDVAQCRNSLNSTFSPGVDLIKITDVFLSTVDTPPLLIASLSSLVFTKERL